MQYRVLRPFEWHDQRGRPISLRLGQIVQVSNRHDAKRLTISGQIGPVTPNIPRTTQIANAPAFARCKRVGLWTYTSNYYSGGRVHLYQYALSLAKNGCDVWIMTNRVPRWQADYPSCDRLHILLDDTLPPDDLDLLITDAKHIEGNAALAYKQAHPRIPLAVVVFEAPTWIATFDEALAKQVARQSPKAAASVADLIVANSEEGARHIPGWIGPSCPPVYVLPPAVNDSVDVRQSVRPGRAGVPFVVISARSQSYKGVATALQSIWRLDCPCDVLAFGQPTQRPPDNDRHVLHALGGSADVAKFAAMRHAVAVLAPSGFEGFGMVPAEALSVGCPAIVYDLPVLREVYGDRLTYVPLGDADAFCHAVADAVATGRVEQPESAEWVQAKYGLGAMRDRVDALPRHTFKGRRVSAQMIALYGPFVQEALASVYDHVDEILIAYGPTQTWRGLPVTGCLPLIESFPDPDGKIKLEVRAEWADKREMRDWCARNATGNYMLKVDADEIWDGVPAWLDAGVEWGCPRWVHFWHDAGHYVTGGRWGNVLDPHGTTGSHYRWSWWRASYRYNRHQSPDDASGQKIHDPAANKRAQAETPGSCIYHLGHVLPAGMMYAKHSFYEQRDKAVANRRAAWKDWDGKLGECGDGDIRAVDWELPPLVMQAFERAEQCVAS